MELYHYVTASIIIREFCRTVEKQYLRPLVIVKQSRATLRKIVVEFEEFRNSPYVVGAVDGGHIPFIIFPIDFPLYYCKKMFLFNSTERYSE